MEYLGLIGTVTLIHLIAVMSPGPDFLVVMKHSLTYNRKVAVYTALGIGTGIMVHVMYSFVGLALIIKNSPLLFNIVKYLGVAYLTYLGVSSILSKSRSLPSVDRKKDKILPSNLKSFWIGFLTNVLNPKATLFFLSLFTLVIDQETPKTIMVIISAIMVINTALWFVFLAYIITIHSVRQRFSAFEKWFNLIFGILLILVAINIAFG
jgi:RhtB (resistance to homoserine/threonine) family protein